MSKAHSLLAPRSVRAVSKLHTPQAPLAHAVHAAYPPALMRSRTQYALLEARILFDAAGAAAAENQFDNPESQHTEAQRVASEQVRAFDRHSDGAAVDAAPTLPTAPGNTVVVIDSRVSNYQDLLAGIDPKATVRVIGTNEDGVQVISQLIGSTGNVSSLQIISHGKAGAIYLGNSTLNSAALDNSGVSAQLQGWQSGMTANADILILGCDVAQGTRGESFVQKLADLTRADISASIDSTGALSKGGNWTLEFSVGAIDSSIAFKAQTLTTYGDLLVAGPPTTALTVDAKPLIGSTNNSGSVTFSNPGPSTGYAPYIALGFDATGKDPSNLSNGTQKEGVTYVANSARYLGATLPEETILTFDAAGNASTTGIKDNLGNPIVFTAASFGLLAGDQLVILKLPLGSFTPGQPNAKVDFKFDVGANADSANAFAEGGSREGVAATNKTLPIVSRGFFQLGDSATGNTPDFQAGNTTANVDPSWFTTEYRNSSRELEQVPGANDKQRFQALLNIAPGQTVLSSNADPFVSKLLIPNGLVFETSDISLRKGASPTDPVVANTVYAVNVVDAAGTVLRVATQDPVTKIWSGANAGERLEVRATTTGGPADVSHTGNLTLNLEYYIPKNVITNATGGDVTANFDAKHAGRVKFADGDDAQNQAFTADPAAITLNYQTIQIQKGVSGATADLVDPANPSGVRSGDTLTYTLSSQIGDYYGLRDVLVTDTLPDGIDLVGTTATISIVANGQTRTGTINIVSSLTASNIAVEGAPGATVSVGGNGKLVLTFDVSGWLKGTTGGTGNNNPFTLSSSTGGTAGDIYGDVFADNVTPATTTAVSQNGRTDITITYQGLVRDQYRDAANGNALLSGTKINENDVFKNDVRISGTLLESTGLVNPTISSTGKVNSDTSSATVSIKDGALLLEIYAINGVIVTDTAVAKDSRGQPIISPGDNVTYRIRYDTTQGDYTDLKLTAYLPDPVFSATDADASGGVTAADTFTAAVNTGTGPTAAWAQAGAYSLGPNSGALVRQVGLTTPPPNFDGVAGTQNPDATNGAGLPNAGITVTTNTLNNGNNVVFNVGSSNRTANPGSTRANGEKVDLLFTVKAKDAAFDPELILSAQGNETSQRSVNGGVTTPTPLQDDKIIPIVLGTPKIVVSHGVLSKGTTGNQDGILPTAGTVTAGSNANLGTVAAPGTSSATAPFTSTITDAKQVDGNITNIDAGDQVRFGFAIQNTGRSGAYGVRTEAITAPPGYNLASGTANITDAANNFQIRRGDGTLLTQGVDYTVAGNVVTFTDRDLNGDTIVDPQLATGFVNGVARTDGKNIVIISYDTVAINAAYAGATSTSTVGVDKALAGAAGVTNFAGTPVRDTATAQNAKPQVDIRWQGDNTNADKTATSDDTSQQGDGAAVDQMVIGEAGFFDLKVTVPEGTTKALLADINIPAGYKLDTAYNGGAGYDIITAMNGTGTAVGGASENGQLTASFLGGIANNAPLAANLASNGTGTLGQPGGGARINLGDVTNTPNNNTSNNSFIVRVRLIADNTATTVTNNQAGTASTITSNSRYNEGVDAATGAGGAATNVADTTTTNDPTITIAEPVVTTVKTVAIVDVNSNQVGDQPGTEADENDIVEYTIVLNNPGTVAAYDLAFQDIFPTFVKNDVSLNITSVTSSGASVDAVSRALTAADFTLNTGTRTLTFDTAKNIDLVASGTITIKVRATLNNTAATVTSFSNTAETTWTSLNDATNAADAANTLQRSGALGGALLANGGTTVDAGTGTSSGSGVAVNTLQSPTGNGLNNYRTASSAAVPVVALTPVLSRIGTINDTSPNANNNAGGDTKDGSPSAGTAQDMVVGELTRFRMVVKVPAGTIPNFALQPTLPTGYEYLGDAKVAFVSDNAMTSTTLVGAGLTQNDGISIAGNTQTDDGTGKSAIWKSVQNNLVTGADTRAATVAPTFGITANTATNGGSTTAPRFELGDISNTDNDIDSEYIVIEFTAVVKNVVANQQGTNLDTSFIVKSGAGAGTQLGNASNITRDKVVEPYIATVDKSITDITGGTAGATNTVTLKDSFTNTGSVPAYDVTLTDPGLPGANTPVFGSLTVGGTTYATIAAATAAGITVTANGNGFDVTIPKVNAGQTVSLTYTNVQPTNVALADNSAQAEVKYTNTQGATAQTFAGATGGAPGTATGERTGADAGNPDVAAAITDQTILNNQVVRDGVGFAMISGTLWDDTNNFDGNIDGGERLLNGVTVTLLWAGADGIYGNADDRTMTTTTGVNGAYSFGALPGDNPATAGVNEGKYRITAPTTVTRTDSGDGADTDILAPRFDRTDGATGGLNVAELTLASGVAQTTRDFGYIQPNDAPVNSFNGSATFPAAGTPFTNAALLEDTAFAFSAANNALITIADPDGNQGSGQLTTTLVVTNGTLAATNGGGGATVGGTGTTTVTITGTQAQINTALATLQYTPTNNFSGAATITVTTNDQGQGGNAGGVATTPREAGGTASPDALQDVDVINLTVGPRSDAPRLTLGTGGGVATSPAALGTGAGNSATQTVTGSTVGTEDTTTPLGLSVASADPSNPETITTVTITNVPVGWQLIGGTTSVTSTGLGNVFTIPIADVPLLGFKPVADLNATATTATLTIVATSRDGAGTPTAATTGTLNVTAVTTVNDAPAFTATTTTFPFAAFNEDTTSGAQTVLASFPGFSDPKDVGEPNGADARVGVVLTANAATAAQGTWQYSPDGVTWVNVPTNLSDSNAIYLPDAAQLRFVPAANFNGTPGNLTARLVEDDHATADLPANNTGTNFFGGANTATTIRTGINLPADGGVGGTSRISANTRDVGITVSPVNDQPTVVTPANTPGTALAVGDIPISFTGGNSITLGDTLDYPSGNGPVVTVTITPTANGRPFISALTPGVTLVSGPAVGSVPAANGTAIVLSGTIADINATLQNLEYRSRQFYNGNDSFTVQINDNNNGGPAGGALQAIQTVNVNNIPLNDRPVPTGTTPDYAPLLPGGTTPGRSIQDMFGVRFTDPRDAPTVNGGDVFAGVAIISTPPASQGIYQYSIDGGSTWISIAANTTSANALVLGPNAQVRFVANPAFTGETTPLQAVLIESDQPNTGLPGQGDLLGRAGVPFDGTRSAAPVSGTIINLSTLEATESATTTNGIGRSRFSSVVRPMSVGVRIDVPVAPQAVTAPTDPGSATTPLPDVLAQFLSSLNLPPNSALLQQLQAEAAADQLAASQSLNTFGNTGLQPNWIAPDGLPGINPFTGALPQQEASAIVDTNLAPRREMSAEEIALRAECAKPRAVVAKPRPPGFVAAPRPTFEPGSPAAKRFSEQIKRARELRAKCATLAA
jgi:large repetitive protein